MRKSLLMLSWLATCFVAALPARAEGPVAAPLATLSESSANGAPASATAIDPLAMLLVAAADFRLIPKDAPTVTLAYPPPNTSFSPLVTPSIPLQATVNDPDEAIAAVLFYACQGTGSTCTGAQTLLGAASTPPYQMTWTLPLTPTATGYVILAQAQNTLGEVADSSSTQITIVAAQSLPAVVLVAPVAPRWFVTPAAPVLYATASAAVTTPPSTIVQVDFLDDGVVIASLSAPNSVPAGYAAVWANPAVGPHRISVRATDSLGDSVVSAPVDLYVDAPDTATAVTLTAPQTGQIFTANSTIPLAATVTLDPSAIQRVEFLDGNRILATVLGPPYTASWVGPLPGNYTIVARAIDDFDAATTSPAAYVQVLAIPRAPAVVLTAPVPGSTVKAGAPLTLTATALSPDGGIGHVDFYNGATLLGSSTSAPFSFTWANPQVGSVTLLAKAYDLKGVVTASAPVAVTVVSSLVPTVTLSAPSGGATFNAPASITVSANASESGGGIAKVDFYANGNPIGTATTSPYSITWGNVAAGNYVLSAKATDMVGTTAASANVSVTVNPPQPTIALTAPAAGSQYAPGQTIALTAQATTPGSTITSIEFDSDAAAISTITVTGGVSSGTYTLNWSGASAGKHALTARVFAASGASSSSAAVSVTVVDLAVALLQPVNGEVFQTSTPITLLASPTETNGTIAVVNFYADGALVASASAAPFAGAWNGATAGTHVITAQAVDGTGFTAASPPATVTVVAAPTIQVDSGIDGQTVSDDNASVSGTVQAPLNSAVIINGLLTALDPNGHFFIDDLKLLPGSNTINLTLNSQGAAAIVQTITINSTGIAPFAVTLDKQEGLAPLTVNVLIQDRGNVPFQRITIDPTNDGNPALVLTGLPPGGATQSVTYSTPGTYTMRVTVYDANDNIIYTATRRVRVVDPAELANKLVSVYTTLVSQLAANNVNGALTAFVYGTQPLYASVFAALGSSLPAVAGQLGNLNGISESEETGELTVTRTVGNATQVFMIYLMREIDGIWRIENM